MMIPRRISAPRLVSTFIRPVTTRVHAPADGPVDRLGTVEPVSVVPPALVVDYRFTLANERTLLAWQRTALGLLAAAVASVQIDRVVASWGPAHVVGVLLGGLALLASAGGLVRWHQVDRAMRSERELPRDHLATALGAGVVVISVIICTSIVARMLTA